MRKLGMSEDKIQELHDLDWKMFNSERCFKSRQFTNAYITNNRYKTEIELTVRNMEDLLNQLEQEELYEIMQKINHQTIQIICLKICGFATKEIASQLNLKEDLVRYRIKIVRKKLKN